jgi:hypothetical protein
MTVDLAVLKRGGMRKVGRRVENDRNEMADKLQLTDAQPPNARAQIG